MAEFFERAVNVLALLVVVVMSAPVGTRAATRAIQWASVTQGDAFAYGPYPQCLSGGWGAGKTWAACLKAIWLSTEFPRNKGVIARHVGRELRATTAATFYKVCPARLYDRRTGGRRSDQNGYLKFSQSESEILFLHLDDPDTLGIIRGLEINWFLIDQAEENPEHMEEIFDLLCARLGRWDVAEVPQRLIDLELSEGRVWQYTHPESGKPVPPPYPMLCCNPDVEIHWLYRRFHPESHEHQTTYKAQGYRLFHMPSTENRFLGETNMRFLMQRDAAFIRRNVDGIWGLAEGSIHVIDKTSLIPGSPELLEHIRATCLLFRTGDHGDSAPTACAWWAVDRNGNVICVAPDVKLLTADLRWIPAGSIRVGDEVAGFDELVSPTGRRRWQRSIVLAVQTHRQPSYRLTLSDGTSLVCSGNHQWLVKKNDDESVWRPTQRLKVGHRLVKPLDMWETDRSYGAGYLAAAYDGEGSFGHTNKDTPRLSFTQNPNVMLARVQAELSARNFAYGVYPYEARATSVALNRKHDVLRFLGSIRPVRLLPKFDIARFGGFRGVTFPTVVALEFLGDREVVAVETSTRTYIAEGLASHNCYREYYMPNALVSTHRKNISEMSVGERYEQNLADPSIFHQMPQKQGGRWSVADEYADVLEKPRETAIFWQPADNNELGTRNRINEYLTVDPERVHPFFKETLGAPRLFFLTPTESYPQGCYHVVRETRAQRRVKIGTDLGKAIFSDERDPSVVDHAYDCVRYEIASRPPVPRPAALATQGTFAGAQRLAKLARRRLTVR